MIVCLKGTYFQHLSPMVQHNYGYFGVHSLKLTTFRPQKWWFPIGFSFPRVYFQGRTVSFREGISAKFQGREKNIIGSYNFGMDRMTLWDGPKCEVAEATDVFSPYKY